MDFWYITPPLMVTWQAPKADNFSKIVLKDALEDFDHNCKNNIDSICRFFHELFYD